MGEMSEEDGYFKMYVAWICFKNLKGDNAA